MSAAGAGVAGREALVGGLAFGLASLAVAMPIALADEAFFENAYRALGPLWRENAVAGAWAPDGTTLAWFGHKLLYGLGMGLLYRLARPALAGSGARRGAWFGVLTGPLVFATHLGLWSVMPLPAGLMAWWGLAYLLDAAAAGAAMGIAVERFAGRSPGAA